MFKKFLLPATLALGLPVLQATAQELGSVSFNQNWIESQHRSVDVEDTMAIFHKMFAHLPDRAYVWPTENYYYFTFVANGREYSGNFRLHPEERLEGLINFAYFDRSNPKWIKHELLGEADGVIVKKLSEMEYSVSVGDRDVVFELNSISQEAPVPAVIGPHDQFVGRSFDESGLIFLLMFDNVAQQFFWALDPDQMAQTELSPMSDALSVHVRSGFVFLQDATVDRQILVGVDSNQVLHNTYYDGPFDQLPDNTLPETAFKELAEQSNPQLRGMINRRGEFVGQDSRMAVMPYLHYKSLSDVWSREQECRLQPAATRLRCLVSPSS